MNVALSRVRKKVYVLFDQRELRNAAQNNSWEGTLVAEDLLRTFVKSLLPDAVRIL